MVICVWDIFDLSRYFSILCDDLELGDYFLCRLVVCSVLVVFGLWEMIWVDDNDFRSLLVSFYFLVVVN